MPDFYVYDIETYPNVFTLALDTPNGDLIVFEISDRRNDAAVLLQWLYHIKNAGGYMVGFNNIHFDYFVTHQLIANPSATAADLYKAADSVINYAGQWPPKIWPRDIVVNQLDLFLINHFNNKARGTGLKVLEFNMRSDDIGDLPYTPGSVLTSEQIDQLIIYNKQDVKETRKFLQYNLDAIAFRFDLINELGHEVLNYNDTKIGKEFFIKKLTEQNPNSCYLKTEGRRGRGVMQQTPRDFINIGEIIYPYVKFNSIVFNSVLDHLKEQTITETKAAPELNLTAYYGDVVFQFGNGGMHASREGATVKADDEHLIIDLDVTSYYPSLAIVNRNYPEHLSDNFCNIYENLKKQRVNFPKGSAENKMLKLALNGVYGDSNNEYSPFYDPLYTMTITVNGQLLLCMLAESLVDNVNGLKLIQVNTDGLTVKIPKSSEQKLIELSNQWQKTTGLDLERADYSKMFIRDVNNYVAVTTTGDVKTKGAFCHVSPVNDPKNFTVDWHKNHSALIVPKAAVNELVNDEPVEQFIKEHLDDFDFMLRAKLNRSSRLEFEKNGTVETLQRITRYYVDKDGGTLTKVLPPLEKAPEKERRTGINVGYTVTPCNNILDFNRAKIDYDFYITEALKLVKDCQKCTI